MPAPTTTLLGPLHGLEAAEINRRFNQMIAAAEWGHLPALDEGIFSAIVADLQDRPRLFTFIDLFCGAGGSSIGLTMAGGRLLLGANHSARAIATHSANFRDADHLCQDLNRVDMRRLPRGADILWASVICTEISPAGGRKRRAVDNPAQGQLLELDENTDPDVFEATRYTAQDVIRATEAHRFPIIIVENVVEFVTDWELFGWWLDGMSILGYDHQIVSVSAAHIGGPLNPHAAQRRNRVYVVFNRRDVPKPDLEPRPLSMCVTCGPVEGVQVWKKPEGTLTKSGKMFLVGKYGPRTGQYVYLCPNGRCGNSLVTPYERPAAQIIDWSNKGTVIGERKANGEKPLVASTIRKIDLGLKLHGRPDLTGPVWNPFNAGVEGVPPGAFIHTHRKNVVPTSPWSPLTTVSTSGNHHGIVVPYYSNGVAKPTSSPLDTCTTKDRFALVRGGDGAELDVLQAYYRMLTWQEQKLAQRFPGSYIVTGDDTEKKAQTGNAVATNVAAFFGERCAAVLNRTAAN